MPVLVEGGDDADDVMHDTIAIPTELQNFDWATSGPNRPGFDREYFMNLQRELYKSIYTPDAIWSKDINNFNDELKHKNCVIYHELDDEFYSLVKVLGLEEKKCQALVDFIHKCQPKEGFIHIYY